MEAIIYSMTPEERRNPDILKASRKRRIAAGSGRSVEEVNKLEWVSIDDNFFDMTKYAGEGNIGHIIEEIKIDIKKSNSI